jgi:RNA-directed DNA polymerase
MHGNREIPESSTVEGTADRSEKAIGRTADTHDPGKSDRPIVPQKESNNGGAAASPAETVEGRGLTKGNTPQATAPRTQGRAGASSGLGRVRAAARKDKEARFTALLHHVTFDLLKESFYSLKREAAPGVDGMTWKAYENGLEERLRDLKDRVHRGSYRAQPSRRTYIPKSEGRMRPLGIASLEDKIVQQALVTVLNQVYEEDFLGFSYGFRPGRSQHDALDALWVGIMHRKVNWVLDADIRGFFDALDHGWLIRFVEHRIADQRVLRLIRKWLRAGVSEDGKRSRTETGTPQGAVVSPLLANVYLHYVLDLWVNQWRQRNAKGDVIVVRYADDFAMGFQYRAEAERFLRDLQERLQEFGLSLHPEKTRLIEFGRFAAKDRKERGQGKPESFDFLGFTHSCSTRKKDGKFIIRRKTIAKRLRATLKSVKETLMRTRHRPVGQVGAWLGRVLQGYFNYYAVPGNRPVLDAFRTQVQRSWLRALRRRSQKDRMTWARFRGLSDAWLPRARILHPYPSVRFYAKHPR